MGGLERGGSVKPRTKQRTMDHRRWSIVGLQRRAPGNVRGEASSRATLAPMKPETRGDFPMDDLVKAVLAFRDERDWKQFHNPKDLAISITLEAAELLEHFQWKRPDEVEAFLAREEDRGRLGEEMADVLILLISLADAAGLDLLEAARRKLRQNATKYPVERARGTAKKYDELVP